MKFSVSPKENFSSTTISILVQDSSETIFHLDLPGEQDNIDGWYIRFTYLHKARPQELNELLVAIPKLLKIQVDEDAHPTYLHMLHALSQWVEKEGHELQEQGSTENGIPGLQNLHQQLKHALFNFEVITSPHNEYYEAIFPFPGQEKLPVRIPGNSFDKAPVQTSQVMLNKAQERDPKCIEYFIHNYLDIQEYVISADPITFKVFSGLSKALVKIIKQENANLGIYISLVPDICTFIVKNELDSEEQKEYLEPILRSFETVDQKLKRLNGIITDVKNEISLRRIAGQVNERQLKEVGYSRLMHVIGLMSDDYLKHYDLDSSAKFWYQSKSKDILLWFFLTLHRWPLFYLLFEIAILSILFIFAYQHWLTGHSCPLLLGSPNLDIPPSCSPPLDSPALEFIAVLPWYILLSLLIFFIFIQIIRRRWLYSQLLLPRLLGAAIVGLLPLLLNDQSWNIGTQSSPFNWSLLVILTYTGSFIYIFIEVHSTKKLIKGHSVVQVLRESRRIFLIALTETLFMVTVASSIIFPTVLSSGSDITKYRFGIYASTSLLSVGFFPFLIILWTGFALFIGSFIQLIWQDRRITESI
ncbi:MAG: hypothetical protein ACJ797_02770 [Ktedonobacteraceae bacterium]